MIQLLIHNCVECIILYIFHYKECIGKHFGTLITKCFINLYLSEILATDLGESWNHHSYNDHCS